MAGKNYNDRILASEVRTLALEKVKIVLKKGKGKFFEQILIRLAGTLLPRLNELTGENGDPMKLIIQLPKEIVIKNGLHAITSEDCD